MEWLWEDGDNTASEPQTDTSADIAEDISNLDYIEKKMHYHRQK